MPNRRSRTLGPWFLIVLTAVLIWVSGLLAVRQQAPTPMPPNPIVETPQDRILILAPHPDDDILGCAGVIQKAIKENTPVKIVYLTNGDTNEWSFLLYRKRPVLSSLAAQKMGEVRHDEAVAAAKIIGLSKDNLAFLGYPDFGTMNIWYRHWNGAPAYKSLLTHVTAVPYASAFRPGAAYKGEEILEDLKSIFQAFKPTKIFVSHPGDHNVDHRALYLFMRIALWDLKDEMDPEIFPYIIHFKYWPRPGHYHPQMLLNPPALFKDQIAWSAVDLLPEEVAVKELALRAHRSQFMSSGLYLKSFIRRNEIFGDFPVIKLGSNDQADLPSESKEELLKASNQLSDNQKLSFVGVQERTMAVKDGSLEVTIHLSRPLGRALGASIYLYGYRHDQPFKTMPKLRIKVGALLYDVFDQRQKLPKRLVRIRQGFKTITVTVPLSMLGSPEKVLTSAQTYLGKVPLDWLSWRIIELTP